VVYFSIEHRFIKRRSAAERLYLMKCRTECLCSTALLLVVKIMLWQIKIIVKIQLWTCIIVPHMDKYKRLLGIIWF